MIPDYLIPSQSRPRKKSAAKQAIVAFSLAALVASCSASPVAYTQVAGPARTTQMTDATDFNCPGPPQDSEYNHPRRTRMAVGMPASSMIPPPPPPAPPPPSMPALAEVSAPSYAAQGKVAATPQRSIVVTGTRVGPMAHTQSTEKYPLATINSVKQTAENPVSTFAMEVDTASYANARRFVREGSLPPADAVRVEEFLNYFDYGYQKPADRKLPFSTTVAVTPSPWAPDKQIVHVGLSGYDIARRERPPLNLTMLMDVSGSMTAEDRLPLAKRAMALLAPNLTARDRVSIVVYAGAAGVVLKPTAGNQTRDIVCALEILQAGGSTAGGEGIRLAYDMAAKNYKE
jgi:Ca-activated chloride channel family protein